MTRSSRTLWACLNAAGLAFALVCNGLANAVPLNGMNTGQISALYPNLFVPAGLTFSIWGLIYLSLLGFAIAGFVVARHDGDDVLARIGPWFVVNTLANGAWIFAWHWLLVPLSLVLMLVILASLIAMYLRVRASRSQPVAALETWAIRAPISLYLGWITVATIANVTALAVHLGAPAYGTVPAVLTVVVIAAAVGITGQMLRAHRDVVFAGAVAWATAGIIIKRASSSDPGTTVVLVAAAIALASIVGAMLFTGVRSGASDRK